ncbi:hypothetical protein V7x_30150 [Crateriforma conspicua]|uniref:Uncharacterized protein n=1 Tax=Crateriforma conspicua TaxID=2527996 RepID=A0A5C6FY49_9PLAN|nr:hypothetical protein V7x_30150 [Crateriforma conspicua]
MTSVKKSSSTVRIHTGTWSQRRSIPGCRYCDAASEAIPWLDASRAAAKVPLTNKSTPKFAPALTPDSTASTWWLIAKARTQSTGVPSTLYLSSLILLASKTRPVVTPWPHSLRHWSGAATMIWGRIAN